MNVGISVLALCAVREKNQCLSIKMHLHRQEIMTKVFFCYIQRKWTWT